MKSTDILCVNQHPTLKLMDKIEGMFASGADELNSEEELLALLEGLNWRALRNYILNQAKTLYEFTTDGPLRYFGAKLLCEHERATLLYVSSEPAQTIMGVTYQRQMELWVSEDMEVFVTSCFRTVINGGNTPICSEYRAWQGNDWLETELDIDFRTLAQTLKNFSSCCMNMPIYEVSANG